jgi:multidrug efflux system outer membrane protein
VRRALPLLLAAVLTGCTAVQPQPPVVMAAPDHWQAAHGVAAGSASGAVVAGEWWRQFGDPALDALIAAVDAGNLDLQRARARVFEARAARNASAARLRPEVTLDASAVRSNARRLGFDNPVSLFEAAFDAGWEVDLFSATANRVEAAQRMAQSAEAAASDVRLTLRAEVARSYIELRAAQQRLRLAQDTLRSQRETALLVSALQAAGLRSELDLAQAESPVRALEAAIPALETAIVSASRRLDTLIGQVPGAAMAVIPAAGAMPMADALPLLAQPAVVIARRPDLRRVERELAAASALAAAAAADFYPKLSLGSLAGYRNVKGGPAGLIWTLAAGLAAPVYNAGRLDAQAAAANARQQQLELAYRQAVLMALEEVEVALSAYLNAGRNLGALDAQIETERRRLGFAEERYRRGVAGFSDVLEAQRALHAAEIERVDAATSQSRAYIALNKAIGG